MHRVTEGPQCHEARKIRAARRLQVEVQAAVTDVAVAGRAVGATE
jgi:hypothetical protein